jgi:hypothetical protein
VVLRSPRLECQSRLHFWHPHCSFSITVKLYNDAVAATSTLRHDVFNAFDFDVEVVTAEHKQLVDELFGALQATELGQFPVYMAEKTATVIFPIKPGGKQKRGPWERDDTLDFGHALSLALRRQCKKQRPVAGNRVSLAIKFGSSSCRIPVLQISEISRNSGILSKRQSESLLSRCFGSHQEICRRRQPPWTAAVHSRRRHSPYTALYDIPVR